MKLLYIMLRIETSSGVLKKVRNQVKFLADMGIDVSIAAGYGDQQSTKAKEKFDELFEGVELHYCKIDYKNKFNFINKINYLKQFYSKLQGIVNNTNPDFLYYRGLTADSNLFRFSKQNKRKLVFEINTLIREEYRLRKAYGKLLLNKIFMKGILNNSAACITVTDEIAASLKRVSGNTLVTRTISNGVDVNAFPISKVREKKEKELNLIFVGHIAEWHGLDRIIRGLVNYNGDYNVKLYIVGAGALVDDYKKMVDKASIVDKVVFCGLLYGEELQKQFDICDIAIASLGMHRINLNEGSILKTREYFSRGFPIVLSYMDVDLDNYVEIEPYYLKVPANDDRIDIYNIVEFYESVQSLGNYHETIRTFAQERIDLKIKMKELFEIIHELQRSIQYS